MWRADRPPRSHSQRDSCGPSAPRTRAAPSACPCVCPATQPASFPANANGHGKTLRYPAVPRRALPFGKTSSFSASVPVPDAAGEPTWEASRVLERRAGIETGVGVELAVPAMSRVECSCSCGVAVSADALATAPGRWPRPAPVQSGAASNLSSCVYFLEMCCLVHCFPGFSCSSAELPLPAARSHSNIEHIGPRSGHYRTSRRLLSAKYRIIRMRPRTIAQLSLSTGFRADIRSYALRVSEFIRSSRWFPLVMHSYESFHRR